ncbi:MAG TPA: hypothetical protein VGR26_04585 [Acidimicrobiales bacterium]|nr:hypothetical protein [Acidimicrobiales bacterium]
MEASIWNATLTLTWIRIAFELLVVAPGYGGIAGDVVEMDSEAPDAAAP